MSVRRARLAERAALSILAERIIDRLDELEGDPDLEDNGDYEEGGDGDPTRALGDWLPGDPEDAEEGGDAEPDSENEPDTADSHNSWSWWNGYDPWLGPRAAMKGW